MAFKYYEEYLEPEGAPEMPEDKRGDEEISEINADEQKGKSAFINLAVLTLTLVFCAMIVFVLRENDYTRLEESKTLDKKSFVSGEFFGSLEEDVVEHLALRDGIIRTDNFLHYFCGVGNELMEREEEEVPEQGNAFRPTETNIPGGNSDTQEHEVVTRVTTEASETATKKTKKTKKKNADETTATTVAKIMTTTTPLYYYTTTTTTTTEETTTTAATNNAAPNVTTKVTTASTQAQTTKETTKATTKKTTKGTTKGTTKDTSKVTEQTEDTDTESSTDTLPPDSEEQEQ